jgi:imidazolonepropionase-like amidohydrolase
MPEAAPWQFKQIKRVPDRRPRPEKIVLKGRVFTGTSAGVIEDGFVSVEGNKITAVGPAAELGSGAENAKVLGGPGKTVLPGLFNNHAHLAWDGANDLATQSLEDPPEISAYKSAANMIRSLNAGVTTVRDLGMNKSNLVASRRSVRGSSGARSCSSVARRSSRPAATPTGAVARPRVLMRCAGPCESRCAAARI